MIRAPGKKPITLPAIQPNRGLIAIYRKELEALIVAMHNSAVYWVTAAWRKNPPAMAQDAVPSRDLQEVLRRLSKRWQRRFDEAAPELARYFSIKIKDRVDGQLESILDAAGFSVGFTLTAEARDVLRASMAEQVGLIKSISQKYFTDVEGAVMRAAAVGRDLETLTEEIGPLVDLKRIGLGRRPGESDKSLFARTWRRAEFISLDQTNKATATITRVRQDGLGITEAIWMHSAGGKEPRPEHVAWGAKKNRYKISQGMWSKVDGQYVWPGTAIHCRCVSRSIIPGLD